MEEFRALIVDTVVWKLVISRRIKPADFSVGKKYGSGCLLGENAKNLFIRELEKKLNSTRQHPVTSTKMDYRRCMEYQILQIARVIQGRQERYQPLLLK
ncbi:CRISPR-associated endonuclease Cas1 [Desulforhopalus vacuolatus]|uniref:CRISPR-associated endonuclease Cas1 n=1 Tax=Desulforhopalus vacuolatus TaxID=40414 RepID=UPI0030845E6F